MACTSDIDFSKPTPREQIDDEFNKPLQEWEEARGNAMGYQRNWIVHPYVRKLMKLVDEFGVHNLGDPVRGSRFAPNAMR